jgi:predicted secreted Zn-dependent protease
MNLLLPGFTLRCAGHGLMKGLLLLAFIGVPAVEAEPLLETGYSYYSVTANSGHELPASLNRATPIRYEGKPFHAYTDSRIRWRVWWQTNNQVCSITRVKVFVDIAVTLPRLEDSPAVVREVWGRWYPDLVRHENGHRDNALAVARSLEGAIRALPASIDCRMLEQRANALGNRFIAELAAEDRDYDARTNYGETQGAWIRSHL